MKLKFVLLALLLCVAAMPLNAQAAGIDYGQARQLLPNNYVAPRMDCDTAGMKCVLVAYDTSSNRVKVFKTADRFVSESYPLVANYSFPVDVNVGTVINMYPSAAAPYDVVYLQADTASGYVWSGITYRNYGFIIAYQEKVYGIDVNGLALDTLNTSAGFMGAGLYRWFIDHDYSPARFLAIDSRTGVSRRYVSNGVTNATVDGKRYYKNHISAQYIGGSVMDANTALNRFNYSFILFFYNSTSLASSLSNTTDAMIGGGKYNGFFEYEERLSSYRYFIRNSTHILQYDQTVNGSLQFWKMGGNNVVSQGMWQNSVSVNDKVIAFQNSSGIFLYNTFASSYVAVPEEYNESLATRVTSDIFGIWNVNDFHSPKVACTPNFGACAMLVYDAGVLSWNGAGLKLYFSTTPFQPNWQRIFKFTGGYGYVNDYGLQYDIAYNVADGKFRIIDGLARNIYEWDGSGNPVVVYVSGKYPLVYADPDGEWFFMWDNNAPRYFKLVNLGVSEITIFAGLPSGIPYGFMRSVFNITNYWYDIYNGNVGDWNTNLNMHDDFGYSGAIQYYYPEEGVAFMERNSTVTPANVGKGMYYAGHVPPHGADWVYPSVSPYYMYDVSKNEETEADSSYFGGYKIYGVAKHRNDYGCLPFLTCSNLYFYRKSTNPVFITAAYYDALTGLTNPLNVSMQLICLDPAFNYTALAGDDFHAFQLPCNSNINLTLSTVSAYPFYATHNFDFFTGCSQMNVYAQYIKTFTSVVTVRDQITGDPIVSATVYVDGIPYVTDAQGHISFVVAPTSAEFAVQSDVGACLISLVSSGEVSESHFVTATKTGYYSSSQTIAFTPAGVAIYLNRGEFIVSRVYYKDGVEATGEKSTARINISGVTNTYVVHDNIPVAASESNDFPVTFQTVNVATTYDAKLGLTWGNYTAFKTVHVTPSMKSYGCNENACFTLPFYSTSPSVGCTTDLDCEQQFCVGNVYKQLDHCDVGTGQCVYGQTACPAFCASDVGCYTSLQSNTSCNFDSECYPLIGCLTTAVLNDARCSSSLHKCVTEHVQCAYGCLGGACKAAPVKAVCDQSTVEGILNCVRSGIMGFIGGTYDPLFTLIIVIAGMVIFVTLLSLAIKGISNVMM